MQWDFDVFWWVEKNHLPFFEHEDDGTNNSVKIQTDIEHWTLNISTTR